MTLRASLFRELVKPNLSVVGRAELCCELAREFENRGEYEEACDVMSVFWPRIGEHPKLEGLFHLSSDPISKFALLELVKNKLGLPIEIIDNPDFRMDRSLDSSAFRSLTGFTPLPWTEMVDRMFDDPTPYDEWRNLASI